MTEHLTAEIVQLTVSDIARAIEWMKFSYLYVRIKKACISRPHKKIAHGHSFPFNRFETLMNFQNPEHYAVKKGISRDRIEKHMQGTALRHW